MRKNDAPAALAAEASLYAVPLCLERSALLLVGKARRIARLILAVNGAPRQRLTQAGRAARSVVRSGRRRPSLRSALRLPGAFPPRRIRDCSHPGQSSLAAPCRGVLSCSSLLQQV